MAFMRERLKQRRLDMGLTLQEVADVLGVEKPTVQRYESGVIKSVDTLTVEKLAKIIKCSPAYLMGWTDEIQEVIQSNLSCEESEFLQKFKKLKTEHKYYIMGKIDTYLEEYGEDNGIGKGA